MHTLSFCILALMIMITPAYPQHAAHDIRIVGAMKNVMRLGQLGPVIDLDTLSNREHLTGMGPLAYLRGEITIIDGRSYVATVLTDTTMKVEETYHASAPFFGYTRIAQWTARPLPESIQTFRQLEQFLDSISRTSPRPFFFALHGIVASATVHVMNLPDGMQVESPEDARTGQRQYTVHAAEAEVIGFFSTEHATIFTHHDTYLHMHLITADRKFMGHLDEISFKNGPVTLYLPAHDTPSGDPPATPAH